MRGYDSVMFITLRQAATRLGKSLDTLHAWRQSGRLECTRIGRLWHTTDEALARMIAGDQPRVVNGIDWHSHESACAFLREVGAL